MFEENDCLWVDGLIVEPTKSNQYNPNLALYVALREQGIPMVMINAAYEELNASYICLDDVKVGFMAAEYLIKKDISVCCSSQNRRSSRKIQDERFYQRV